MHLRCLCLSPHASHFIPRTCDRAHSRWSRLQAEGIELEEDEEDELEGSRRRLGRKNKNKDTCTAPPSVPPVPTGGVWAVDVCASGDNTPEAGPLCTPGQPGCSCLPTDGTAHAAVRCCNTKGRCKSSVCSGQTTNDAGFQVDGLAATLEEAARECAALGQRVCSEAELRASKCKFCKSNKDKCGMNEGPVWSWDTCTLPTTYDASEIFDSPPPLPSGPPPAPPIPPIDYVEVAPAGTSYPLSLAVGPIRLPSSAAGQLFVLMRLGEGGEGQPAARSYDGHDWERTQGGGCSTSCAPRV